MDKLTSLLQNKTKVLPGLIIVGILVAAGTISFAFSPKSPFAVKSSDTDGKEVAYAPKNTQAPIPTVQVSAPPPRRVLAVQAKSVSSTPIIPMPTVKQQTAESATSHNTQSPTNTPVPQQNNPTATPAQAIQQQSQTVSVEIKAPDGTSSFTVEHTDGMTVCDVLQKAKDAGKIQSVTIDDSYMSTLRSKYVSEINGHTNNWTFTINGSQPLGCSLANPKPTDTVVWKFG